MAVNQAQVDHIISTASADDPEVKLLKLQDEVELLKTSIKRLLIDIRERMNDMENPLNVSFQSSQSHVQGQGAATSDHIKSISTFSQPEVSTESANPVDQEKIRDEPEPDAIPDRSPRGKHQQIPHTSNYEDETVISEIKSHLSEIRGQNQQVKEESGDEGKVRLQKVFRLFEWTTKNVRNYGHDRVDLMLESYRAMGYISNDAAKLVKDIARLIPTTLGEVHDISADEYVSELYELNHILNPNDVTLDRDMIEVLMEKRGTKDKKQGQSGRGEQPPEQDTDSGLIPSRDRI
jgi:hypothetical protein